MGQVRHVHASETAQPSNDTVLIALVDNQGSRELVARVEAELLALGFRVHRLERRRREPLPLFAARSGAVAAVAVRTRDASIELWGEDPDSGGTAFADVVPVDTRRGKDVAAVAAAEALRGRLLRLGVTPQTLRSEVKRTPAPAPVIPAPEPDPSPRFGAFFGVGAGNGTDGVSEYLRVGAEVIPSPWLSLSLSGSWQPLPDTITAPEGNASVRVFIATLGADLQFVDDRLRLGVGPAFLLGMVDMEGTARGNYSGRGERVLTTGATLHGMSSLELVGPLHLRADAEIGLAMPRVVVRFAGRDVASWGRPYVLCTLGLGLLF